VFIPTDVFPRQPVGYCVCDKRHKAVDSHEYSVTSCDPDCLGVIGLSENLASH